MSKRLLLAKSKHKIYYSKKREKYLDKAKNIKRTMISLTHRDLFFDLSPNS